MTVALQTVNGLKHYLSLSLRRDMTDYPSKKVLIIDDDPSIRETLSYFLLSQGFHAESVEDGDTALKTLQQSPFDLLIVDVDMPRMNGIDLLKCLKEKNINTPSIIITGLISDMIHKEANKLKVLEVMEKPLSLYDILGCIQKGLRPA